MAVKKVISRTRHVNQALVDKEITGPLVTTHAATWDCNSCGTPKISGLVKVCPNCTHPKDDSETYQESHGTPALTDQELAAAGVDPTQHLSDELCQFCGAKLKPGTAICPHCNGMVDDVGYVVQKKKCEYCGREYSGKECPNCSAQPAPKPVSRPVALPRFPELHMLPKTPVDIGNVGIVVGVVVLVLVLALLLWPREHEGTVVSHDWKRTINTEEYEYLSGDGWSTPANSDIYATESRVKEVIQVSDGFEEQCHYEKQQIGSIDVSSREEVCETVEVYDYTETIVYDDGTQDEIIHTRPEERCDYVTVNVPQPVYDDVEVCTMVELFHPENVYATYYFYHYWDWVRGIPLVTSGSDLAPYWPVGNWTSDYRQSGPGIEEYSVVFSTENGKTYTYTPNTASEYRLFEAQSAWKITTVSGIVTEAVK